MGRSIFRPYKLLIFVAIQLFFGLLLLTPKTGTSQNAPSIKYTDSLTLDLYHQQNWDKLIDAGKEAIGSGMDYYYLRMRIAIAYYEKENYRTAIKHFEKALEYNLLDQTTIEYLYFSYLLSGRNNDARMLAPKLSDERKKRSGINQNKIVELAYFEAGPGTSYNTDLKKWQQDRQQSDSVYSKMYLYNNVPYLHGGLKFRILPQLSTYQGYSFVSASSQQKIDYLGQAWPDFYPMAKQNEYYGNIEYAIPSGLSFTAAVHSHWINYENREDYYNDSLRFLMADTVENKINDYVFSLAARKEFGLFALEVNGTYGQIGHLDPVQAGLFFYTYPFGNLNLYTQTGLIGIWSDAPIDQYLFHQMIGVKLVSNCWFEAETTIGDFRNYSERNAFTIYNLPEKVNYKIEGNLIINVNEHLDFSLRGRYVQRVATYTYFPNYEEASRIDKNYGYFSLFGGLKWTF